MSCHFLQSECHANKKFYCSTACYLSHWLIYAKTMLLSRYFQTGITFVAFALALEQWEVTLATKENSKEHHTVRLQNRAKILQHDR